MKLFVGALVLWMYTTSAYGQDRCYFSRLDVLPCPSRPRAPDPEINEYGIYRTRIGFGKTSLIECRRRGRGVVIRQVKSITSVDARHLGTSLSERNITTLGAEEIRLLYSPGFELDPKEDYANQMLVIYNIQCKDDERIFFNITHQDIEPKNCTGAGGELVCPDYVEVDRGIYGRTESCGTEVGMNTDQLEGQNMTVRFRTSEEIRFPGFEMIAICYRPEELNLPGCTLVDEEQSGNGSSTDHLKKRDLQEFHNMWQHRPRRRAGDITSKEIIVAFGDQVTYWDQQITVLRNNVTVALFRNIAVLQTLDAEGRRTNYMREARDKKRQFIFFRGPGPMTITGRRAYFQLFVFDPRVPFPQNETPFADLKNVLNCQGIIPTEAEGRVIRKLTESQFSQLSPRDDVLVEDPDLATDFPDIPIGRRKRRTSTIKNNRAFNVDAVRTSIMNENACNPVLRASSRATLTVNKRIDARRVRQLRERLQVTTQPPTREATKPAVKTELTVETERKVETEPIPATAPPTQTLPSLNCNVEIEGGEVGTLNCMVPAGTSHTTCFFDGMREERSLQCNEFPTRFRLEQFSKGKHNVTVEVSMTVTFEVP